MTMKSSSSAHGSRSSASRIARLHRMAEPVALVPVPGDPRPGVLGHAAVDQQAPLERHQPAEDRLADPLARVRQHENRGLLVQPGHPSPLVQTVLLTVASVDDDDRGLPRGGLVLGVQRPEQVLAPGIGRATISGAHLATASGTLARYSRRMSSDRGSSSRTRSHREGGQRRAGGAPQAAEAGAGRPPRPSPARPAPRPGGRARAGSPAPGCCRRRSRVPATGLDDPADEPPCGGLGRAERVLEPGPAVPPWPPRHASAWRGSSMSATRCGWRSESAGTGAGCARRRRPSPRSRPPCRPARRAGSARSRAGR